MDGPQRPKLVESSADHPGIRRIICLMTLNYQVISYTLEDVVLPIH